MLKLSGNIWVILIDLGNMCGRQNLSLICQADIEGVRITAVTIANPGPNRELVLNGILRPLNPSRENRSPLYRRMGGYRARSE